MAHSSLKKKFIIDHNHVQSLLFDCQTSTSDSQTNAFVPHILEAKVVNILCTNTYVSASKNAFLYEIIAENLVWKSFSVQKLISSEMYKSYVKKFTK